MADEASVYHQLTFTILFTAVFRVDSCNLLTKQTSAEIWPVEHSSVHIFCDVSVAQCQGKEKLQFTWHVLRKSSSEPLIVDPGSPKYSVLQKGDLEVKSFHANDSGIYFCGVTVGDQGRKGQQMIGHGTVVTVTVISHQIQQAVLWLLFVVLALYSLIVLALLIMKMMGRDIPSLRGNNNGSKNNSTRRRHFRAVLQELYSKRNLHSPTKTPGHRPAADSEFENPHTPTQDDDIYQNM
ncbi:hypothetical protein ACEWY4_002671 [Coilia grayii]|uniref:Ig-like domain-containing protein n=1 Tax=Coilia grayii TaxID=363190 RepID=A0ABD1KP38_9TELE